MGCVRASGSECIRDDIDVVSVQPDADPYLGWQANRAHNQTAQSYLDQIQ
jgi:hypothetical protein